MKRFVRLGVVLGLLSLVATVAFAQFDEKAEWKWYSGPPADPGSTLVGERWQQCNYAVWWGEQTQYEIYLHIESCDWCPGCPIEP
jgi:hypothetical protein